MDAYSLLSNREQEVAALLLQGKSNKQIAAALHITQNTVEFHLKNIYAKLQVSSRTELMLKLGNSVVAGNPQAADNETTSETRSWWNSVRATYKRWRKELNMDPAANTAPLTFFEAVRVCMIKYAEFSGRASRPEFWWFALAVTLVASALTYLSESVASVFGVLILLPFLAVGARRLRDVGKSPWWLFFLLVPVGGLVTLGYYWAQPAIDAEPAEVKS
jgi:DNA-binding CsgD family transcriptional regulator